MFEHLKEYSKILVSGPQRAGTTICTKMIAMDTGYKFLSQAWLEGEDSVKALNKIWQKQKQFVIQCPGESHAIERFSDDNTLIVFMIREIEAIIDSQRRHNWHGDATKKLYNAESDIREVSVIKYERWEEQKKKIIHWLEINYNSLSTHSLFIPKSRRTNWHVRQIDLENRFQDEIMYPRETSNAF